MNTLYRVTNWSCSGPKLEKMGETKVSRVKNGVAVLYYKDGKRYLTPEQVEPYHDERTAPYEYYFEDRNKNMYLIVDKKKEKEWDKIWGIETIK